MFSLEEDLYRVIGLNKENISIVKGRIIKTIYKDELFRVVYENSDHIINILSNIGIVNINLSIEENVAAKEDI